MATPHPQLRQLRDPQGVQKNTNTTRTVVGKTTPRNTACQGCHARKKRCVTVPSQYRCANCCREGRNCVPRETSRSTRKQRDRPSPNAFNIPLPHGIDHEVPRWSAMYSMFSEMMRLIPPERTVVDLEGGDESTTRYEDEDETTEKGGYVSEQHSRPRPSRDRHDTQDMNTQEDDTKLWNSSVPNLLVNPVAGREEDISRQGMVHPAFNLGDLDALLRF